jgi:hyaluronoglucosaminidase
MGMFTIAGVLEGFYGPPWLWTQRRAVMERCVPAGLPWFAWAPKSDPLHRDRWRDPFTDEHLAGFADLLNIDGLKLCLSIAPGKGLSDDLDADAAAIVAKCEPVLDLVEANGSHTPLLMLAFDDLSSDLADGERHGELVARVEAALGDRVQLAAVPVHYAGVVTTEYLRGFSAALPPDVLVGWTGAAVVNQQVLAVEAEAFSDAVDGRPLLLWDNYPVNDVFLADRLFLRPLVGRDSLLSEFCPAYFANAGLQPNASLPALLSIAAYCETGDAAEVWDEFEQPVQLALLAEACDGSELRRLAEAATADPESQAFDDLWWWLERLEVLELDGDLGAEVQPWVEQVVAEADLALVAMDLLERTTDDEEVSELIIRVLLEWPKVRSSRVSVFGPRFAVSPQFGVQATGEWRPTGSVVTEGRNATDVLIRAALARHTTE